MDLTFERSEESIAVLTLWFFICWYTIYFCLDIPRQNIFPEKVYLSKEKIKPIVNYLLKFKYSRSEVVQVTIIKSITHHSTHNLSYFKFLFQIIKCIIFCKHFKKSIKSK